MINFETADTSLDWISKWNRVETRPKLLNETFLRNNGTISWKRK